jgi:vacuolar protein sorting-associated protein 13D
MINRLLAVVMRFLDYFWWIIERKSPISSKCFCRFNISLQIERRVVTTNDPHFPSVTISGNLPRLVVHVNEQKVESIRSMYHLLWSLSSSSPIFTKSNGIYPSEELESPKKEENVDRMLNHAMRIQFIIDQMTFELQSRGRSVAELQVDVNELHPFIIDTLSAKYFHKICHHKITA